MSIAPGIEGTAQSDWECGEGTKADRVISIGDSLRDAVCQERIISGSRSPGPTKALTI